MRRSLPLAALLACVAVGAEAAPRRPVPQPRPDPVAAEAAVTECMAQAVMATPGSVSKARAGLWYEAAGVMGHICRPEFDRMVAAYDAAKGPGAGGRRFEAYVRGMDRTLAVRLGPELRQDVAHAEPRD